MHPSRSSHLAFRHPRPASYGLRSPRILLPSLLGLCGISLLYLGVRPLQAQSGGGHVLKISTIAGTGNPGFNGNNIPLGKAQLYWPQDIYVDPTGNIYILEWNNHQVRKAKGLSGKITTVIGSGFLGDGGEGPATQINPNHPTSLTMDSAGRLVLAAWHNWKVKRVNADGNIQILAGTSQGFSGDGSLAPKAQMDLPSSAEYDAAGNLPIAPWSGGSTQESSHRDLMEDLIRTGSQAVGGQRGRT